MRANRYISLKHHDLDPAIFKSQKSNDERTLTFPFVRAHFLEVQDESKLSLDGWFFSQSSRVMTQRR